MCLHKKNQRNKIRIQTERKQSRASQNVPGSIPSAIRNEGPNQNVEKYVKAADLNLESMLAKKDMQLPTSHSLMPTNFHPSEDVSNKLNARGVQSYQKLIGELRWAVQIGRVHIFLELLLLSSHLALPQSSHLEAVY